ncbi:hypothetical protein ACR9E3_17400 [Actinomycetospora sp. C-140]
MIDSATRESQDRLLEQAVGVLRTRYELGTGYPHVSSAEAEDVVVLLEAAINASDTDGADRKEAVALAHRLVDNDHPEASPLWPRSHD